MQYNEIALVSNSSSFNLINSTIRSFPTRIDRYVIDGSQGLFGLEAVKFLFDKFKSHSYKWIILVDEDVIFSKPEVVFDIIERMVENDYTVAGVRDGGEINHRNQNPYLLNSFFVIINFAEVCKLWKKGIIDSHQFIVENEFDDSLDKLSFEYDESSLFEPYYCFFLWLRRQNFQFLFLNSDSHLDGITNQVVFENTPFLIHAWYSREYDQKGFHQCRINDRLKENEGFLIGPESYEILRYSLFNWKKRLSYLKNKLLKRNLG